MRGLMLIGLLLAQSLAIGEDASSHVQEKFNLKYGTSLSQNSTSLLPLPQIDKSDWKKMLEARPMTRIYSEPNRFYNNKTYTFTMYRDDESGRFYLDAKGGFWGMDELVYGPLNGKDWE